MVLVLVALDDDHQIAGLGFKKAVGTLAAAGAGIHHAIGADPRKAMRVQVLHERLLLGQMRALLDAVVAVVAPAIRVEQSWHSTGRTRTLYQVRFTRGGVRLAVTQPAVGSMRCGLFAAHIRAASVAALDVKLEIGVSRAQRDRVSGDTKACMCATIGVFALLVSQIDMVKMLVLHAKQCVFI